MLDMALLNPPGVLKDIEKATQELGFTLSSDLLTGSLLRTLAASKPGGSLLEIGTGTGMGTAWILDGMDATAHLLSIDKDATVSACAQRFLGHDQRVTFQVVEGDAFILRAPAASFDFIFADTPMGKFALLDETLHLLKSGGLYIIDDLLPQPGWEEAHLPRVVDLVATLEKRPDLRVTKLDWSTGLLVATKR